MKRTLTLKSESLAELTSDDLIAVVGGAMSRSDTKCTLDRSYLPCTIYCPITANTCDC